MSVRTLKSPPPRVTVYCEACRTPRRIRTGDMDREVTCKCGCSTFCWTKEECDAPVLAGGTQGNS
jgi:hypothetical protein